MKNNLFWGEEGARVDATNTVRGLFLCGGEKQNGCRVPEFLASCEEYRYSGERGRVRQGRGESRCDSRSVNGVESDEEERR